MRAFFHACPIEFDPLSADRAAGNRPVDQSADVIVCRMNVFFRKADKFFFPADIRRKNNL